MYMPISDIDIVIVTSFHWHHLSYTLSELHLDLISEAAKIQDQTTLSRKLCFYL